MNRLFPSLVIVLAACQDIDKQSSSTSPSLDLTEISSIEIQSVGDVKSNSILRCVVDAVDENGAPTAAHIEWRNASRDTRLGIGDSLRLQPQDISPNEEVECVARVGTGDSIEERTARVVVENTEPTLTDVQVLPSEA